MARPRSLDPQILQAALEGFELQKQRLAQQIAEVRRVLGTEPRNAAVVGEAARKPRRKMSAAARQHIAEVQRKRWAKWRKQKAAVVKEAKEPRRKMSAAGRKRIATATRKRWAEWRKRKAAAAKK